MTQKNQPKIRYTLDFDVTPHQLRHTYITNLLYAGVDPKTVQYVTVNEVNSNQKFDLIRKSILSILQTKNVNYNLEGDTHQVTHQVIELSTMSKQILAFCTTPKSKKELAVFCGFKDLRNFTLKHINPLLESGQLEMTIPDKPKSRNQKYITVRSE